MPCGLVTEANGVRTVEWTAGPSVEVYSREDQPSDDPVQANRCGWNARTHVEYEGRPAVDWYIPTGTPLVATMDGSASLIVYTLSNPFDVYGVDRGPYLGNPDGRRAPLSPFPGAGGGQGEAVHLENDTFRAEYAHLEIGPTLQRLPAGSFVPGFSAAYDYASEFSSFREFGVGSTIARWQVHRGDILGYSGDSGYSEAPHLHYAIVRLATGSRLCPTAEPGFEDGGWLLRSP